MTTVTVVIDGAWLTPVDDLTTSIHATFPARTSHKETAGEVRNYAGGRTRIITSARKSASFPLTLQIFSDADVALLESWHGRLLLLRDVDGRREFGTLFASDVEDSWSPDDTLHSVSLTFTRVSYDESVS